MRLANLFRPSVLLTLALMVVIIMMILPMPAWLLDIGLAISFGLAILMFSVTLFIERPLEFSAFPTILLASLMLRLSLNVSSTKLIIGEGHSGTDAAGGVIEGFANFVMGGSLFLGVVVFCVLLIVNFIVITKGATRMAEVGARFALDGMPGKQLAIDSDLSAGAIDHHEAKERRDLEQAETTFFGSLDGASKFVKGDAIAGLLITLLNLVMGIIVGSLVHSMPIGRAFETYAILTVGDGLVNQIPAVIISIASALLLARGGSTGSTNSAIFTQLGRFPAAIATVAVLMSFFAIVPGLPFLPFIFGAIGLGLLAWNANRGEPNLEVIEAAEEVSQPKKAIGDMLDLDDIHIEFAPDLIPLVLDPATGLDVRVENMRNHVARHFGLVLPEVRLTDDPSLPTNTYLVRIQGVEQARDQLRPGRALALVSDDQAEMPPGEDVAEPVYGAPARWIEPSGRTVVDYTVVSPVEVLATHLLETIKRNLSRLMTLKSLRRLLDELSSVSDQSRADTNRRFFDEVIPDKVPIDLLLSVLKLLLEERVSIRNLALILEAIIEARGISSSVETITEHVRQSLGFQLVADLRRPDGTVPLVQLDPDWEKSFAQYEISVDKGRPDVALPPDEFNRLASAIAERLTQVGEAGTYPALITSLRRRKFLWTVLASKGMGNPVLSFEELGLDARPALVGTVAA